MLRRLQGDARVGLRARVDDRARRAASAQRRVHARALRRGTRDRRKGRGSLCLGALSRWAFGHAADPLPVVRAAQPDRVHVRRRRDASAAARGRAGIRVGRLRVPARQPARTASTSSGTTAPVAGAGSRYAATRARTTSSRARPPANRWPAIADDATVSSRAGRRRSIASRPLAFEYDGARYEGYAGDTLASALLANGVHLVGRSFKYHRPRGIYSAGAEEPNALVQLARGARSEPNTRATTLELLRRARREQPELLAVACASTPARSPTRCRRCCRPGFYYKTFMWPPTPRWWLRYEHVIRRAAGMGRAADAPDPDHYEHQYAHCDVLVIGAGPAGLAAARVAAAARCARHRVPAIAAIGAASVVGTGATIGRSTGRRLDRRERLRELAAQPDVTLLSRTTAFGYYDANLVGALERVTDHLACRARASSAAAAVDDSREGRRAGERRHRARHRLREQRSARHDARRRGAHNTSRRYGVRPGTRAVVFTNNDGAYAAALALHDAGVAIAAIVDARSESQLRGALPARARETGLAVLPGSVIAKARGRLRVSGVEVVSRAGGAARSLDCDLVAVSGGYSPAVHLFRRRAARCATTTTTASFLPDRSPMPIVAAGAVQGHCTPAAAIADGEAAAHAALAHAGIAPRSTLACTRAGGRSRRRRPAVGRSVAQRREVLRRSAERRHRSRHRGWRSARAIRRSST